MRSAEADVDAYARILEGRALLRVACDALAVADVVPVVLKGVLLSALAERLDAPPRAMVDVDLLVRPSEKQRAEDALVRDRFEVVWRTPTAIVLRHPRHRLELDLHTRLVEDELFHLDASAFHARSLEDRTSFGHLVRVPERLDLYAHLVAHFARGRSNAADRRRVNDFALVARALPMDAAALASHLEALGLARAARYALPFAVARGDAFAASVLAALPPDSLGVALAAASRLWLSRYAGRSHLAIPALHALNTTVPRGARSLGLHALRGLRSRAARMLERPLVRR